MDWVGLTGFFFHESKCLFYYRLEPTNTGIDAYLDDVCHCRQRTPVANKDNNDYFVVHHSEGRRSSLLDLPADILESIDTLTQVDQQLYKVALKRFCARNGLARSYTWPTSFMRPELAYLERY
jgi:hypothetical protein